MIDQLIAKCDGLPALPTERRLLFLHRGIGRAAGAIAHRKMNPLWIHRITNRFP